MAKGGDRILSVKPVVSLARRLASIAWLLALTVPLLVMALVLLVHSQPTAFLDIAHWFDPLFFQYNIGLFLFAVLIVPAITYFYVTTMKCEKLLRLRNEFPQEQWERDRTVITQYINRQLSVPNYLGSMTTLMLLIATGASVMLFLKPVSGAELGAGVDYSMGANILLLGPYVELFKTHDEAFFRRIVISLTAFQFGFLGAYVYFIGRLVRSYFTLDLTPHTFVASTVRIVTGSLLALVLSFLFVHTAEDSIARAALPAVSFFFGYFPERALVLLTDKVSRLLQLSRDEYKETPLSQLPGMNFDHRVRLAREGYDNVDNLANASPAGLALITGFGYPQLRAWVGQAWLKSHLRGDYDDFVERTGIMSADGLLRFLAAWAKDKRQGEPAEFLCPGHDALVRKIRVAASLLSEWQQRVDRKLEPAEDL